MSDQVVCHPFQAAVSCRIPTITLLRSLVEAGVHLVEIVPLDVMPMSAGQRSARFAEIATNVREAGIGVWSVHVPFGGDWDISAGDEIKRLAAVDRARSVIELCRRLRPRKAIVHASAEPITDADRPARIRASRQSLMQLAPGFAADGVQLALENLPRTCLGNTAEEIGQLTDGITGLGLCLDVNHLLKQPHEYYLSRMAGQIVSMHCSDYDGVDERHWMPGEGIAPWKLVIAKLSAAGYAGPFLFETWSHKSGKAIEPAEYVPTLQRMMAL